MSLMNANIIYKSRVLSSIRIIVVQFYIDTTPFKIKLNLSIACLQLNNRVYTEAKCLVEDQDTSMKYGHILRIKKRLFAGV
jgi:hypothetical protein